MKRIIVVIVSFVALCSTSVCAKNDVAVAAWDSANTAYIGADYETAERATEREIY